MISKLDGYKLQINRQRPAQCYRYEKKEGNKKITFFTMDSGKSFLTSCESKRLDSKYYLDFSQKCNTIDECLNVVKLYEKTEKEKVK